MTGHYLTLIYDIDIVLPSLDVG